MHQPETSAVRVLFVCTGLGIINRGIETFFRSAFDGLKNVPGVNLRLLKGAGAASGEEHVLRNLARTRASAQVLGILAQRNGYVIEQWSSLLSVIARIHHFRPHVIFYSDANLGFLLFWLRRWVGVPYTLLFSNGGPVHAPFIRTDYVHQVAPCYYEEALQAGEPPQKHLLVPYGVDVPAAPSLNRQERDASRRRLGLPVDCKIVLSVGWISAQHKRMDYVIKEVAKLPLPRPFLLLLGQMDGQSQELITLGNELLGKGAFAVGCVPHNAISEYYRVADCFVLASLQEGFGRVYLEALMHGLPVLAHSHPVSRYVLDTLGVLDDLSHPGTLAHLLAIQLQKPPNPGLARIRWQSVRDRFGWPVLAPRYRAMFQIAAGVHREVLSHASTMCQSGVSPASRQAALATELPNHCA